ncbi:MAG: DUF429 domain-containing protein [Methylococcaceae bacterium]|nr:DUF429 domain-containing protein [Methylococcaceae bacterium]
MIFQALNRGVPLPHGKHAEDGLRSRLELVAETVPEVAASLAKLLERYRRSHFAIHDAVDTPALAIAARMGQPVLSSVPANPEFAPLGLPMEIVFPVPQISPETSTLNLWPCARHKGMQAERLATASAGAMLLAATGGFDSTASILKFQEDL